MDEETTLAALHQQELEYRQWFETPNLEFDEWLQRSFINQERSDVIDSEGQGWRGL